MKMQTQLLFVTYQIKIIPMTEQQKNMIKDCIESHRRMIKYHRAQIIDLSRSIISEERKMECFNFNIVNKNGRSSKS